MTITLASAPTNREIIFAGVRDLPDCTANELCIVLDLNRSSVTGVLTNLYDEGALSRYKRLPDANATPGVQAKSMYHYKAKIAKLPPLTYGAKRVRKVREVIRVVAAAPVPPAPAPMYFNQVSIADTLKAQIHKPKVETEADPLAIVDGWPLSKVKTLYIALRGVFES